MTAHNYVILTDMLLFRYAIPNHVTVEQEIFATGNFRNFQPQAIHVQEIFDKLDYRVCSLLHVGNILVQEIFANLAKFAKMSCMRKFAVLQY